MFKKQLLTKLKMLLSFWIVVFILSTTYLFDSSFFSSNEFLVNFLKTNFVEYMTISSILTGFLGLYGFYYFGGLEERIEKPNYFDETRDEIDSNMKGMLGLFFLSLMIKGSFSFLSLNDYDIAVFIVLGILIWFAGALISIDMVAMNISIFNFKKEVRKEAARTRLPE